MRVLGIDVGGSSVKLAALENGKPVFKGQSAPYSRPDARQLAAAITHAAAELQGGFEAVGICVPGLLDPKKRRVTQSVNLPGLTTLTLDELVEQALGKSIRSLKIVNDAIAGATDIVHSRKLSGRVLCIAMGTGVGAAVLDDGVPLLVEGDSSGHIGQMDVTIGVNAPIGPDGGAGSLEAYIGVPAIVRQYGDMERFFSIVKATDPALAALARAIRICHAIYRPHHVVLIGGVGIRLRHLIADLRKAIERDLTRIARPDWTFDAGDHDFHAAIGAARLASI